MRHPDLKSLVWGKHLHRLLGACGVNPVRPEPAPRLAHPLPAWFQWGCAALTLLGLVGLIRFVDASLRPGDDGRLQRESAEATFDASAWDEWSPRMGIGVPTEADSSAGPVIDAPAPKPTRLGVLPGLLRTQAASPTEHHFQLIQVTAYTSESGQTDASPHLTATNSPARPGALALSRDLLRSFTPGAPFGYGDKVLIPGVGVFEVSDTMHPRWKRKADIWVASGAAARAWGRRTVFVTKVGRDAPTIAYRTS